MEINEKELADLRRDAAKWRKVEEIATNGCPHPNTKCPLFAICADPCLGEYIVHALSEVSDAEKG